MRVLGIETSCDETGVAVYDSKSGLIANVLSSQDAVHNKFGGIVPELASRDHIKKILPIFDKTLEQANILSLSNNNVDIFNKLSSSIDVISYTVGPGLIGSLLVGANFAKSLAFALNKPAVPVHHMEAHLLSVFLKNSDFKNIKFPFLALLISGGHTILVHVMCFGMYKIIGKTLDDAVGESFDKVAKILGLNYPGGALLSKLALKGKKDTFYFPRPMIGINYDFSFSGLKTHVLYVWQKFVDKISMKKTENSENLFKIYDQTKADIAREFQQSVVDVLVTKTFRALKNFNLSKLILAGGVSANGLLRNEMKKMCENNNYELYLAKSQFCTDNGAMVAYCGYQRVEHYLKKNVLILKKFSATRSSFDVVPRISLEDVEKLYV